MSVLCSKVKMLGDSDNEDDSAAAWVMKSRQLEQDRRLAEQRVWHVHIYTQLFFQRFLSLLALHGSP